MEEYKSTTFDKSNRDERTTLNSLEITYNNYSNLKMSTERFDLISVDLDDLRRSLKV